MPANWFSITATGRCAEMNVVPGNSATSQAVCRKQMTTKKTGAFGVAGGACFALCLVLLTSGSSSAATTPIYKCLDKNLGLLYTDLPCKDGERLDVRAGDADPAAVERLERQTDALDQSAAQRIADQRHFAAAGEFTAPFHYGPRDQDEADDYSPGYMSGYGFYSYPVMHHHLKRPRKPEKHQVRHFAPRPPHAVAKP